ncbi:hypothetical protein CI238_07415, partial [Colletotrichum incanum]
LQLALRMFQHSPDTLIEVLDKQDQLDPHQRLALQRRLVRSLVQTLAQPRQNIAQTKSELGRVGADADQGQTDVAVPRRGVGEVLLPHRVDDVRDDLGHGRDLDERRKHVEEALGNLGVEEGLLPRDIEDGNRYGAVQGRVILERLAVLLVHYLLLARHGQPQDVVLILVLVFVVVELDLILVIHLLASQGVLLLGLLLAPTLLSLHLGQPFHLAPRVLDPQLALGRAETAPAHEVASCATHVAVGGGPPARKDPEVGVGGHHAQGAGHGAAPALRGLDIGRVGEVFEPELLTTRMSADSALVDGEDARLARVLGGDVADLHALAALGAKGLEGLLPFRVGAEVVGVGAGGEDAVLKVAALLDDCANLILCKDFLFLPFAQLGNGTLQVEAGLVSDSHICVVEDEGGSGLCFR